MHLTGSAKIVILGAKAHDDCPKDTAGQPGPSTTGRCAPLATIFVTRKEFEEVRRCRNGSFRAFWGGCAGN